VTTRVQALADWAATASTTDTPEAVLARCRAQRRSLLAALAASVGQPAALAVRDAIGEQAGHGPAPLLSTDRRVDVASALYAAAAWSIALDFDDYLCFGHTGHSAVLTPLLLAAETEADGAEQIAAQAVANEVAARLGGACLLGPQNGQEWSFIHSVAAAVAAGRLFGLGPVPMAHALALACAHPPRSSLPGVVGAEAKLLLAAEPAVAGVRAARLAAAGVTGPLDVLDHAQGFFSAFATAALPGMLEGADGWATLTLSVKAQPGCAYLGSVVEALDEATDGGRLEPDAVERVVVEATAPTCAMEAASRPYAGLAAWAPGEATVSPVTVNFSVAWTVAVALHAGRVGPDELKPRWLAANRGRLARLARGVAVRHDPALTARTLESFLPMAPPSRLRREAGVGGLARALRQARGAHGEALAIGPRGLAAMASRGVAGVRRAPPNYWAPVAIADFTVTFPARARLLTQDGHEHTAQVSTPAGSAGHPSDPPEAVGRTKLGAHGPSLWGNETTTRIDDAVRNDEPHLWELLGSTQTGHAKAADLGGQPPRSEQRS
jgi:2-methylcitrate dehydratase PrpD